LYWRDDDCGGEAIYCSEPPCENFESCSCRICSSNNYVIVEDVSPEYNGRYQFDYFNGFLEGNRPVFQRNGKCVWWHRKYRHWWIGPCENVGMNDGFAYFEQDRECPWGDLVINRGGSEEIIYNAKVNYEAAAATGGGEPHQSSGTAGVNAIIRNGQYKQICRPVYRNGRFRCPKTTK
jgi:hypothetical protein